MVCVCVVVVGSPQARFFQLMQQYRPDLWLVLPGLLVLFWIPQASNRRDVRCSVESHCGKPGTEESCNMRQHKYLATVLINQESKAGVSTIQSLVNGQYRSLWFTEGIEECLGGMQEWGADANGRNSPIKILKARTFSDAR